VAGWGGQGGRGGAPAAVGAARFMGRLGLDPSPFAAEAARLSEEGGTPLYLALGGRVAAVAAVADTIRPSAVEAVAALHAQGVRTAMVTGDDRRTALAVARRLGIEDVRAEVMPGAKAEAVRQLRAAHGPVAFVGDGINDAPALAEADVGLAMGAGTDVAIEAAQVVIASPSLAAAPRALRLARATLSNIRQNLFWAFAYNAALIPVAAGVLQPSLGLTLSPMLAAAAMSLSSVSVLANALRLRRIGV